LHRYDDLRTRAAQLGITLDSLEVTILSEVDWRGPLGLDDSVVPAMTNLQPEVKISAAGVPQAVLSEIVRWGERAQSNESTGAGCLLWRTNKT
jgi:hypothetical protein